MTVCRSTSCREENARGAIKILRREVIQPARLLVESIKADEICTYNIDVDVDPAGSIVVKFDTREAF